MLREYEGSGMSGVEYAEYIGVKYPTFASWIQKERRDKKAETVSTIAEGAESAARPVMEWVEAVVEKESVSTAGLVIRLRGGEEMMVRDGLGGKRHLEHLLTKLYALES